MGVLLMVEGYQYSEKGSHSLRPSGRLAMHHGSTTVLGLSALVVLAVAAGGGIYLWNQSQPTAEPVAELLHKVERGDFELTITERGEVEAFDVTEVRSLVKSKNTTGVAILRIVPEGTEVKAGDFLVELDSSALDSEATLQKIAVNTAKAAEIEAHSNYESARIAEREYLDGTYRQERQLIESEIFVAEENLNRYKEYLAYSEKLASKGYVNDLQLEADRFAVKKAEKDLDTARTKLQVLDEYTKPKMMTQLEGATQIAKAKWEAAQNSLALEQEKLAEIEDQIAKCMILAPQAGVVKYAHENDRRGDQEFIVEEGAMIRERQAIILLPNANAMQVKLTINEALVQYVKPGLAAAIRTVGAGDRVLRGTVQKVNQYPEPAGWRRANVKEYLAYVSVDENVPGLRSGLTASVTIECARLPNVLQVPVQALYAHGERMYCFAYTDHGWKAQEVKPGPTNDKFFVIESGLKEGDRVALHPRGLVNQVDLPELTPEEKQRAVERAAHGATDDQADIDEPSGGPDDRGMPGGERRRGRGRGMRGGPGGAGGNPTAAPAVENADPVQGAGA
jgi:multidrug efflux pump subunit AcrA (membrane-fusion protein)